MGTTVTPERFTETLRTASEPVWSHSVAHRFVQELFIGAVPDAVTRTISSRTTAFSTASWFCVAEPRVDRGRMPAYRRENFEMRLIYAYDQVFFSLRITC